MDEIPADLPSEVRHALKRILDGDQREERARRDREVMWQWVASGMKGRLVRINGGPVQVVPCHPDDDGEMRVVNLCFR